VNERTFRYHEGKAGKPDTVKITYLSGLGNAVNEWACPGHPQGFAKGKADKFWWAHGGQRPFPTSVMEWLERQSELLETAEISVRPDGKYWQVIGHRPGTERQAANANARPAENDNRIAAFGKIGLVGDDEEIPF
jgi:DNA repair protein RadD